MTTAPQPPAPPPPLPPTQAQPQDSGVATLIPYKNGAALTSYYLGVFSLIPILGFLLAIPAVILSVMGLRRANTNPQIKGKAHAWVGIILGGLVILGHLTVLTLVLRDMFADMARHTSGRI